MLSSAPMIRCTWCENDPFQHPYHDTEWGVPTYDDHKLFAFLVLEGAQAGLSWLTILKRRDGYTKAFKNFDVRSVAAMTDEELEALMHDASIIRNRLKIWSTRTNAKAFIDVQKRHGSFASFLWDFVGGIQLRNHWTDMSQVPAKTPTSDALSKALKKAGFTFVGSTICYAYMQAMGLVNDHLVYCTRHAELTAN